MSAVIDALRQWAAAERDGDAAEMANARTARDEALAAVATAVPGAVYVVVSANDKAHPRWGKDERGPLVFETYLDDATLPKARARAAQMEVHGACRVARLVFEDEPGFKA